MNKKTIFISFLVIIIVIGAIYIYYTTNSSTAHVNNIKENVSEIIKLQNEITAENKKENKNELTIDINLRVMANDFEVISEEYEQIKSTNDKEEILSYIQNSKITKNTYLSMETYLRKEKINTDLLNIFQ